MHALGWIVFLAFLFEALTLLFRFGLHLRSKTIQKSILPWRIHHGYVGCGLVLAAVFLSQPWKEFWLIIGFALVLSDIAHHLLLLRVTGKIE